MIETIEADEAWWPPTLTPDAVFRTRFAWWTMLIASHRTRSCTASSVRRSTADGVVVLVTRGFSRSAPVFSTSLDLLSETATIFCVVSRSGVRIRACHVPMLTPPTRRFSACWWTTGGARRARSAGRWGCRPRRPSADRPARGPRHHQGLHGAARPRQAGQRHRGLHGAQLRGQDPGRRHRRHLRRPSRARGVLHDGWRPRRARAPSGSDLDHLKRVVDRIRRSGRSPARRR